MNIEFEIVGGAGPRETGAIMAALVRLSEEQSAMLDELCELIEQSRAETVRGLIVAGYNSRSNIATVRATALEAQRQAIESAVVRLGT